MTACLAVLALAVAADPEPRTVTLLNLHKNGWLFDTEKYPVVRAAMAAGVAERPLAGDKEFDAWMTAHPELLEEFLTALVPDNDDIPAAVELLHTLWKADPGRLAKHPHLGIAVAVTWDRPKAVYQYDRHARRVAATMPEESTQPDGPTNFRYLIDNEAGIATHWKKLPWEFLVFVVDHRTPLAEREWARKYAPKQTAAKWYPDVPYDFGMLEGELSKADKPTAKLVGKDYTLANVQKFGGVCAHQADFTARVGKSVGVPGYYCGGLSESGVGHAWWMYVQLLDTSGDKAKFNLVSVGRYRGMNFYTGKTTDPHTGQEVSDRDLERMLASVGRDPRAARQAKLLMRAMPALVEAGKWNAKAKVTFLDRVLKLCPACDEAWRLFAVLVRDGEVAAADKETVRTWVRTLLKTYADYPDFIAETLPQFEPVFTAADLLKVYTDAAGVAAKAGRADLLCDLRLRIADQQAEQKKYKEAFDGVVDTLNRFPLEGRYVPKLTEKLQTLAPQLKTGPDRLTQIYMDFVPKLVNHYKTDVLAKADDVMVKQAVAWLEENKKPQQAATLKRLMK